MRNSCVAGFWLCCVLTAWILSLTGCGQSGSPSGAVVGRSGHYDYSPSVIQTGDVRKFWWCGQHQNPELASQTSDAILYESINMTTQEKIGPTAVLGETPGAWDAEFTCNPRVVQGVFIDPLGDGQTYTYALYYVGTYTHAGTDNSIGVAFSKDGMQWNKYKSPILTTSAHASYGVGQPTVLNEDHGSRITMFYEDNSGAPRHIKATSSDGVHFTSQGDITSNGLGADNEQPSWGDLGYDPETAEWYALFNLGDRPPSTTGNGQEYGQYGFAMYRIAAAALLTGSQPWEFLKEVDTVTTGYESNFLPSLLHDIYGNINTGPYPQIQIYPSISNPQTAWDASPQGASLAGFIEQWDIGSYLWKPDDPILALVRYSNLETFEVTSGWIDPTGSFKVDLTLGHLYESPQKGANEPFYGCKAGNSDYFLSVDPGCAGQLLLGLNGYGYAHPIAGVKMVPLYFCFSDGKSHFISHDPLCETRGAGTLLGYAMP